MKMLRYKSSAKFYREEEFLTWREHNKGGEDEEEEGSGQTAPNGQHLLSLSADQNLLLISIVCLFLSLSLSLETSLLSPCPHIQSVHTLRKGFGNWQAILSNDDR